MKTGGPSVRKTFGYYFWELLRRNPQASAAMNGAMRSASVAMTPAVTAAYKWSQFPVIADVGGGIGTQLVSILDASPGSKGILFDKPHLRAESISHDRMEAVISTSLCRQARMLTYFVGSSMTGTMLPQQ